MPKSSKETSNLFLASHFCSNVLSLDMRRLIVSSIIGLLYLSLAHPVHANYVTITNDGEIVTNVLSDTDEQIMKKGKPEKIDVTRVGEHELSTNPTVSLSKQDDKLQILVANAEGTKTLALPEKQDSLVEIEERPEIQRISIGFVDNQFSVRQRGFTALTNFPLTVDAKNARIVATTTTGDTFISVLPLEAVQSMIRSGIVTSVTDDMLTLQEEGNELQYKIKGEKIFSLLHIYDYAIPVEAYVSATDGTIKRIDSSTWYRFLNILMG